MEVTVAPAGPPPGQSFAERRRIADRVFRGALLFNAALTVLWIVVALTQRETIFFPHYNIDRGTVFRIGGAVLFFYVLWGFIWYGIKSLLLTYFVGFSKEERRQAFSSRMREPFDVSDFVARHSERRIRIVDMIGRRGRFMTLAMAGFFYLYAHVSAEQPAGFAALFLADNLFDAVVTSWIFLAFFYVDGILGAAFYGAQSRVMDGVLARANNLLITTLWTVFKFVLVPIGAQLAAHVPAEPVRRGVCADLGLVPHRGRDGGNRRIALRPADDSRLGHRRRQPQIDRRHDRLLRRVAGVVSMGRAVPWPPGALDRACGRHLHLEHAAGTVLASRNGRLLHGDHQRADLLGLRGADVRREIAEVTETAEGFTTEQRRNGETKEERVFGFAKTFSVSVLRCLRG